MSLGTFFQDNDQGYLNEKLSGSCTMVNGKVFEILEVESQSVRGHFYDNLKVYSDSVPHGDIDFTPLPQGMVNDYRSGAIFLSRAPARFYKRGSHKNNNRSFRVEDGRHAPNYVMPNLVQHYIVEGRYPSLDEACELIYNDELRSCAINKCMALVNFRGSLLVKYKFFKEALGTLDADSWKFERNEKMNNIIEVHNEFFEQNNL